MIFIVRYIVNCLLQRFIEEAESMLAGPVSPQTLNAPNLPQHTPGVIGAQEVYRYD